jgi:hypothetical protein
VEVAVGLRLGVEVEVGEEEAHDTACRPQQEKLPHVENCYKCATASRQQLLEPKRGSAQCGAANGFPAQRGSPLHWYIPFTAIQNRQISTQRSLFRMDRIRHTTAPNDTDIPVLSNIEL